jgi:peptidoglycan hydrolase-like protein with peptidoglycan-binding domain
MMLIRSGMSGQSVRDLQTALNSFIGSNLKVDGQFGPKTLAAVKSLQTLFRLQPDGIVGKQTGAALVRAALYAGSINQFIDAAERLLPH